MQAVAVKWAARGVRQQEVVLNVCWTTVQGGLIRVFSTQQVFRRDSAAGEEQFEGFYRHLLS